MSRVLVVEDEAHLAKGLRFNIEAEGHSVEVSGDGETALDRLLAKTGKFRRGCAGRDASRQRTVSRSSARCAKRGIIFRC